MSKNSMHYKATYKGFVGTIVGRTLDGRFLVAFRRPIQDAKETDDAYQARIDLFDATFPSQFRSNVVHKLTNGKDISFNED